MSTLQDDDNEPTRLVPKAPASDVNAPGSSDPLAQVDLLKGFDPLAPLPPSGASPASATPLPSATPTVLPPRPAAGKSAVAADDQATQLVVPKSSSKSNVLSNGTRISEFEVSSLIGVGGFGIVYLAHDHSLQRTVALKEYMPASFATRVDGYTVRILSDEHQETFAAGLKSFVNEAHLLAQFDHPSLVKVYRFWEGNGTAYMVMPFYEGVTLKARLAKMGQAPDEAWLKDFLTQILQALDIIHAKQCFHRDIAPDNILMLEGDRPVLLDFGAARRVIEGREQALTVILKAGYAPIEQYGADGEMGQGAWTDLYALASVIYFAIMGRVPPPAVQRVVGVDPYKRLADVAKGRYSDTFLRGIDAALALQPYDRPQSVAAFRELLELDNTRIRPTGPTSSPGPSVQTGGQPAPVPRPQAEATPLPPATPAPAGKKSPALLIGAGLAAVVVLGAGGWFVSQRSSGPVASGPTVVASNPASNAAGNASQGTAASPGPATPLPSAVPTPVAAATPTPVPQASATPTPSPVATTAPSAVFDPARMLSEVVNAADPQVQVSVEVAQQRLLIGRDFLSFNVRSPQAGFVYVLTLDAERKHLSLLFPNSIDKKNRIEADKPLKLPRKGWPIQAQGPVGNDQFVVIVSEQERDFTAAGLQKSDSIPEFNLEQAQAAMKNQPPGVPLFAGQGAGRYGAAAFTIEEFKK